MSRIHFQNPYVDPSASGSGVGLSGSAAGGQLSGTYPNPVVIGITETGGPTELSIGNFPDGTFLQRSGSFVVGSTPGGAGDVTGPASSTDDGIVVFDGTTGKVLKNLGLRNFGKLTSDPVGGAEGDEYYNTTLDMHMFYDGTRSKWLSRASVTMEFGRTGNTAAGSYFQGAGGLSFSDNRGILPFHSGTVVGISYTRDNSDSSVFQVTSAGSEIGFISSSQTSDRDNTLDADFSPVSGSLGIKNKSGGNTVNDIMGWILMRWRSN